jgi:phosphoglycolate phosphatase/pyrophosphatase PpaX
MNFDLDGTIGNSLPFCIDAFRRAIDPFMNRSFCDKEIVSTFGPSEEGTIKALIPEHYDEGVEQYLYHYKALHKCCPKPFEGMEDIMRELKKKGIRIAMVTGKGKKSTDITLEYFEITDLFECIETGSINGSRKSEGISCVLNYFKIKPEEAYYIGDAPSDIVASQQVGVRIISAAWADGVDLEELKRLKPDKLMFTIKEFAEFCKVTFATEL